MTYKRKFFISLHCGLRNAWSLPLLAVLHLSLGLAPICPCPSPLSGSSLSSGTCTAFGPGTVHRQKGRPGGVHTRGCGTLPKAFREGLAFPPPATRVPSQWCGSTVLGREKPGFAVRATSSCRSRAPRGGRVFRAAPGRPSGHVVRTAVVPCIASLPL